MKHSKSTAIFLVGFFAFAACTSNSSTPATTTTIAPTTTTTSTTVAPTAITTTTTTIAPTTTTKPRAPSSSNPKTTNTVPQNTTQSSAEILADAKARMKAAETKFALGGSFSNLVASKLQIEKRYASVGMKIIPHATYEQMYYNIKFSGVSNCFLVDFDGSRSVFVPSACW